MPVSYGWLLVLELSTDSDHIVVVLIYEMLNVHMALANNFGYFLQCEDSSLILGGEICTISEHTHKARLVRDIVRHVVQICE